MGECIPLSIFTGLILFLNPSKILTNNHGGGYTKHVEDTDIKSTSMNKDIELHWFIYYPKIKRNYKKKYL